MPGDQVPRTPEPPAAHHPVLVTARPLNAESPMALLGQPRTPLAACFVRCHFDPPRVDPATHRLLVTGRVRRPLSLSLDEVRALGSRTVEIVMECAGNGRSVLNPRPPGVPWGFGAVSAMSFTGAPLNLLLEHAGIEPDAVEVLFAGDDAGRVETGHTVAFERSMPIDDAVHGGAILAWAMNDQPLTTEHGAPLRLVVPGWYGMASVKWLTRIEPLARPFMGFFQTQHYILRGEGHGPGGTPLNRVRVRSLIAAPAHDARLVRGRPVRLSGGAWSGSGGIRSVDVSTDDGLTWSAASLQPPPREHGLTVWSHTWTPLHAGRFTIVARATDTAGNAQPLDPVWTELGYGNNSVHRVAVTIK
jgi:DMSO/TMAO reductase YedYZ molybdopterin-dependent catalytic subunit